MKSDVVVQTPNLMMNEKSGSEKIFDGLLTKKFKPQAVLKIISWSGTYRLTASKFISLIHESQEGANASRGYEGNGI